MGTGKVSDYTWEELQNFRLKDPEGNIKLSYPDFRGKRFVWARGKKRNP